MNAHRKPVALLALSALATVAVLAFVTVSQAVPEPTDRVGSAQPARHQEELRQGFLGRQVLEAGEEAARGTLMTFAFDARSEIDLHEKVDIGLAGQMTVLVLDRREERILARVTFPDVDATLAGQSGPEVSGFCAALSASLSEPTTVLMTASGETLGYRFPAEAISDHRNWVRTLVSAFRFVQGPDGASVWQTTEADATGVARVDYLRRGSSRADFDVLRRRTAYLDERRCETSGQAIGHFREGLVWPVAAEVADRVVARIPEADFEAHSLFSANLSLLHVERVGVDAADWSGPWAAASGRDEVSELAQATYDESWRRRLAGVRAHDLVRHIAELLTRTPGEDDALDSAVEMLAELVRLDPEALSELEPLLADASTDPHVFGMVTRALARAGSAAAQDALADTAENAAMPPHMRRYSLEAMFSLAQADRDTVDRVGSLLTASGAITEVEATAMLVLGSFAERDCAVLLAAESLAREQDALPLWLESLGNAGTPDVLEPARRYSTSGDEVLRAMAMTSLRQVDSPDALAMLARAATVDESATVRSRAVEALGENPAGAPFVTLASIATSDPDERVRYSALSGIYRQAAHDPRARAFLERRAVEEVSDDLRQFVRQLLGA